MKRGLLTGYTAFERVIDNPTGRIAEHFARSGMEGIDLTAMTLPVSYRQTDELLRQAADAVKFDFGLMLGVDPNGEAVRIERTARNQDSARIPDVDGFQPVRAIAENGPPIYAAPEVTSLARALEGVGFETVISDDAGGYLCNHAYYLATHLIRAINPAAPTLFLHMPPDEHTLTEPATVRTTPLIRQLEVVTITLRWLSDQCSAPQG